MEILSGRVVEPATPLGLIWIPESGAGSAFQPGSILAVAFLLALPRQLTALLELRLVAELEWASELGWVWASELAWAPVSPWGWASG